MVLIGMAMGLAGGIAVALLSLALMHAATQSPDTTRRDGPQARIRIAAAVVALLVGAFGSYSLGANNIANVVGVFVPASPIRELDLWGLLTLSGAQQLFLLGAIAIGVGVFFYRRARKAEAEI